MPLTAAQSEQAAPDRTGKEEAERDLVRGLIDAVALWQQCEHRQCRRMQRCVETATCQTKYAEDILCWKREQLMPYLRKRYPAVQWGAPASILDVQLKAALAAEADAKARREARAAGKPVRRKRRRKRVPRQPLYAPPDFADEVA
jgi:hypothetical protein